MYTLDVTNILTTQPSNWWLLGNHASSWLWIVDFESGSTLWTWVSSSLVWRPRVEYFFSLRPPILHLSKNHSYILNGSQIFASFCKRKMTSYHTHAEFIGVCWIKQKWVFAQVICNSCMYRMKSDQPVAAWKMHQGNACPLAVSRWVKDGVSEFQIYNCVLMFAFLSIIKQIHQILYAAYIAYLQWWKQYLLLFVTD